MKREINMRPAPNSTPHRKQDEEPRHVSSAPSEMQADRRINTDPNGMWTGVPTENDYLEVPVQDVDDL